MAHTHNQMQQELNPPYQMKNHKEKYEEAFTKSLLINLELP
jgi:hypothetical protein